LQILVSDNFSQDDTEQVVRRFADSRIAYVNTGRRLGMSRNFEFALSHVRDGWVTYLGDDDGLLPNGLAQANAVIRETGCKALSSKWHHYTWPNFDGIVEPNRLTVRTGRGYEIRDARMALRHALGGRISYLELPGIYIGGFAEFETLNRLRNSAGNVFLTNSPDMYAAVALSSVLDRYVHINRPLSICGASAHSIGASSFKSSRNASPRAQFLSEADIPFHPALGDGHVRSMQLHLYEAYLKASHLHNGFLGTPTEEQLALSVALADEGAEDVEPYCKAIAQAHGIDFQVIQAAARRISFGRRIGSIGAKIRSPFPEFAVDGAAFGLANIRDAAVAASCLYFQATAGGRWRLRKVAAALSRKFTSLKSLMRSHGPANESRP
jgi:hypothetical protein